MGLRGALIILGLLIMAIVALNAYDRGRIKRGLMALFEGRFKGRGVIAEAPSEDSAPPWSERRVLRPETEGPAEGPRPRRPRRWPGRAVRGAYISSFSAGRYHGRARCGPRDL